MRGTTIILGAVAGVIVGKFVFGRQAVFERVTLPIMQLLEEPLGEGLFRESR